MITFLILISLKNLDYASATDLTNELGSMKAANITDILNDLTTGYDKRLRPNYGGKAVQIGCTLHVSTISAVSEVDMDFTVDVYLRQFWRDPRLQFSGINQSLTVGVDLVKLIWVPDTFFPNEKSSFFHEATTHNSFLRIDPNGQIRRSIRLTVTANCPMRLEYFPMDKQNCSLEIESYGYDTADISYFWSAGNTSVDLSPSAYSLPQFQVTGAYVRNRTISLSSGNYSRLSVYFTFSRNIGFYLIQIYLPSSLIVIISWVSFWLNREATQARVAIGVTTVLTMTTLMTSTNSSMPKVSYVKSIDIYLGTCFIIVFASLLEYAAVGYLMKRNRMKRERKQSTMYGSIPLGFQNDRRFHTSPVEVSWINETAGYYQMNPTRQHVPTYSAAGSTVSTLKQRNFRKKAPYPGKAMTEASGSSSAETSLMNDYQSACRPLLGAMGGRSHHMHMPPSPQINLECDCDMDASTAPVRQPIRLKTSFEQQTFKPSNIDKYSRIIFPLLFVSFHIIYWTVYLHSVQKIS